MDVGRRQELVYAITHKLLLPKDQGRYPGAHSEPFFYTTACGEELVLLRAREKAFVEGYRKQQLLYPFLRTLQLPVNTAAKLELIEHGEDTYAVMERFFGYHHTPQRFGQATEEQQKKFVRQVAFFFYRLHTTPLESLPKGVDFTPYFSSAADDGAMDEVFLHADFNYSNFLVDDDYNLHAVFDWHPACIGPRLAEFATFIYCNDLPMLPLVLAEYNRLAGSSLTADQALSHYQARR